MESLYAHLMRLERNYQGIPNELDRLKCIVKEQGTRIYTITYHLVTKGKEKKDQRNRLIQLITTLL